MNTPQKASPPHTSSALESNLNSWSMSHTEVNEVMPHDWKSHKIRGEVTRFLFKESVDMDGDFWGNHQSLLEKVQDGSLVGVTVTVGKGTNLEYSGKVTKMQWYSSTEKIYVTVKGPVGTETLEMEKLCLAPQNLAANERPDKQPNDSPPLSKVPPRKPLPKPGSLDFWLNDDEIRPWIRYLRVPVVDLRFVGSLGDEESNNWFIAEPMDFSMRYLWNKRTPLESTHPQVAVPCCVKSTPEAVSPNHWVLGVVDSWKGEITVYDSMKDAKCEVDEDLVSLSYFVLLGPCIFPNRYD